MAKRMTAIFLAVVLLLCCMPGQAAVLTKAEQYDTALEGLKSYLNDDETMTIADLNESFNALGGYEHSIMLEMYTKVLLFIENGEFTPVQRLIGYMRDDSDFVAFIEENEAFGSLDALEWYAKGRLAEAEKRRKDAADCYRMCSSFMDSASRRRNLDDGRLEEMYQQGIMNFKLNTYDGYVQACSLFQEVEDEGGYEDSKAYLQKSLMYRDLLKPTPKPTVKPTPKPTSKPTAKPTPKPTPKPAVSTYKTPKKEILISPVVVKDVPVSMEVYSGPGEEYFRAVNGKAKFGGGNVDVFGKVGNWYLITYWPGGGGRRVGYVNDTSGDAKMAKGNKAPIPELSFANERAIVFSSCSMTDDPFDSVRTVISLSKGTEVTYLATLYKDYREVRQDWAYIEVKQPGQPANRGFVPMECLRFYH